MLASNGLIIVKNMLSGNERKKREKKKDDNKVELRLRERNICLFIEIF